MLVPVPKHAAALSIAGPDPAAIARAGVAEGEDDVEHGWSQPDSVRGALDVALTQMQRETAFWSRGPEAGFPHAILGSCAAQLKRSFEREISVIEAYLVDVERASARHAAFQEQPSCPWDVDEFAALDSAANDADEAAMEAEFALTVAKRPQKRASQERLDELQRAIEASRVRARDASAARAAERTRLCDLATRHYPEIAVMFPPLELRCTFGVFARLGFH